MLRHGYKLMNLCTLGVFESLFPEAYSRLTKKSKRKQSRRRATLISRPTKLASSVRKSSPSTPTKRKKTNASTSAPATTFTIYDDGSIHHHNTMKSNSTNKGKANKTRTVATSQTAPSPSADLHSFSDLECKNGLFSLKTAGLKKAHLIGACSESKNSLFSGVFSVLVKVLSFVIVTNIVLLTHIDRLYLIYLFVAPLYIAYLMYTGKKTTPTIYTLSFLNCNDEEVAIRFKEDKDTATNFLVYLTRLSLINYKQSETKDLIEEVKCAVNQSNRDYYFGDPRLFNFKDPN